jgi:hypothetical protein
MRLRLHHALLLIPLFSVPTLAQTAPEHHGRRTADQHFADANTTHDGHLTLDQATTGYKTIAKSFTQIDANHHGYVTLDDIKAWKAAKKASKLASKHAADDTAAGIVRPGPAAPFMAGPKATETSTDMVVPNRPGMGVDLPKAPLDRDHSS